MHSLKISCAGWLTLWWILLAAGCGAPPVEKSSQPATAPPGGSSGSLKRSASAPLYYLDRVGETVNPFEKQPVKVDVAGELTLSGWAVDPDHKAAPGGVEVVIDGTPYRAIHNLSRQDVADYFKVPAYEKAGYKFSMAASLLAKGQHQLMVRVISSDGTYFFEGAGLSLRVE